jgi:hypothetical protein
MAPSTALIAVLADIEDPRRAEGKVYPLPHVVLFAILAMAAGANSPLRKSPLSWKGLARC